MTTPIPTVPGQLDDESRLSILSREINARLMGGWLLINRDDSNASAILGRPGKSVNHILHLLLSLLTFGLWVFIWILLTIFQTREKRVSIWIDPFGKCIERKATVAYS